MSKLKLINQLAYFDDNDKDFIKNPKKQFRKISFDKIF